MLRNLGLRRRRAVQAMTSGLVIFTVKHCLNSSCSFISKGGRLRVIVSCPLVFLGLSGPFLHSKKVCRVTAGKTRRAWHRPCAGRHTRQIIFLRGSSPVFRWLLSLLLVSGQAMCPSFVRAGMSSVFAVGCFWGSRGHSVPRCRG
jgi:hypothetical protein